MLEKVLRILFETADVSQIKQYVCRQFTKLLSGRANIQDLIFAKEFRGINGYKPTACVPSLELTRYLSRIHKLLYCYHMFMHITSINATLVMCNSSANATVYF